MYTWLNKLKLLVTRVQKKCNDDTSQKVPLFRSAKGFAACCTGFCRPNWTGKKIKDKLACSRICDGIQCVNAFEIIYIQFGAEFYEISYLSV